VTGCAVVGTTSLLDPIAGESTLDELIVALWEGLSAHRAVACPVCGDEMIPEYGAHARAIGGKCCGCGTRVQ
jgi:hypothetical protein